MVSWFLNHLVQKQFPSLNFRLNVRFTNYFFNWGDNEKTDLFVFFSLKTGFYFKRGRGKQTNFTVFWRWERRKQWQLYLHWRRTDRTGKYRFLQGLDKFRPLLKFVGQTRNPIEATYADADDYFGEVNQPELFDPENRDFAEFDKFDKFEQNIEKFKSALLNFDGVENYLFYAVFYGPMHQKTDKRNIKKENARKILGDELYFDLSEIEPSTMLDKSLFIHFERFYAINQVLAKYGYFSDFSSDVIFSDILQRKK